MLPMRTGLVLALTVALCSTAFAGANDQDATASEARAAIEAANAKFSEAFARGDAKALAARYISDAIVFPPDSDMIRGRTVSLSIESTGKKPTTAVAKYVVVWKRQADGAWKMHRDIWNSLPATK